MPTYEYACPKCGAEFELFQSMKDEPLKKCTKCMKAGVRRLVGGGAGLIFKGSGFYITDYKKPGAGKKEDGGAAKSEAKASDTKAAPAAPSSGSTDSKSSKAPATAKK